MKSTRLVSVCRFSSVTNSRLKIAFFGSDNFSTISLNAIYNYCQLHNHQLDVITPSLKPTGRGLNQIIDLPIGELATSLDIPIHRVSTASDIIQLSNRYNLAIAVSFGKLIPGTFLTSCKYGGVNVHPSLLPRYSGASPLQYCLLNDDKYTGCTVQTLHPTKFDRGDILIQSDEVPIEYDDNFTSLEKKLGAIGAELLVETIDKGLFSKHGKFVNKYEFSLASKIPRTRKQVYWDKVSARQVKRMEDALGSVYTFIPVNKKNKTDIHRVILGGISEHQGDVDLDIPGQFTLSSDKLVIKTNNGCINVSTIQQQTKNKQSPKEFINSFHKNIGDSIYQFIN
ncbi:Methionyl-tRNA formyltransferase mitochondrial [Spathaspora sp. JA1]|nr:Methionyl-tRNA formyltransferase mitochondrial [Spathaspora sp. JA1]